MNVQFYLYILFSEHAFYIMLCIFSDPVKLSKLTSVGGALSVIPKYPENAKEIFDRHLSDVNIELHNKELWDDFYQTGTEMILTRNGRYGEFVFKLYFILLTP